jgi:transcriptional regulator with PAS, ATPase and Fis domain
VEIDTTLDLGRGPASEAMARLATSDPHMSRMHARLRRLNSGSVTLCDLNSRNGTYLDGIRVVGEKQLHDGAILFIGSHVFVYRGMSRAVLREIKEKLAHPFGPVATVSPVMARLTAKLRQLARSKLELLLTGETGAGKEVFAQAIHHESGRCGRFVAINCAALPEGLVESELFGYARGAHSAATVGKPGLIEKAQGGTLCLDEISDMSSTAQAKLLRFLQDGRYQALGTTEIRQAEVRIIAATHSTGHGLRPDLAARLGPEPIHIPPLRERIEDVGLLVDHFLRDRPRPFDIAAYRTLFLDPWHGNVRELEKVVRMAGILSADESCIRVEHLRTGHQPEPDLHRTTLLHSPAHSGTSRSVSPRPTGHELAALLERHRGNVGEVAREIGRQRTLVWRWLRRAGLNPSEYREPTTESEVV